MSEKHGKVFLVEDNLEVSRMYERAFRLRGHEIEIVYDGETALQKLLAVETPPDAIILDVVVPHLNGVQVLKTLRADQRFANVPIVILTNSVHKEEAAKFFEMGADQYLVKIDNQARQVVEQIEELIRKSRTS